MQKLQDGRLFSLITSNTELLLGWMFAKCQNRLSPLDL